MLKRTTLLFSFVVTLACLHIATSAAQEWTRFRGPNGTGVSDARTIPVEWTEDDYNWRIELPGEGHSSPVLWGEKLFVTSADPETGVRYLLCINAKDGSEIWRREWEFTTYKKHRNNSFATSTPAVDARHVYVEWQSREGSSLLALDHDGRDVWTFDLGPFKGGHGGANSPVVIDDMVVLGNDHEGPSFLLALDCTTGKEQWRVKRHSTRATYSTPCVFQPIGRDAEIIFTDWEHGITAIDVKTGRQNWEIPVFGKRKERAIGSPVVAGDLVIGTCGFVTSDKHVVAVRPSGSADKVNVAEVYRIERAVPHVPTALVYDDLLFLWSEKGIATCVDAASGKQHWQKRIGGNFSGSPVCAGDRLYAVDENGVVVVLAASKEFQELARNDLGETSRSTPAIAGGHMFLRTARHLMSIGGTAN